MGPPALLPLRRESCCGFLSPLKSHRPGWGFNPRFLGHSNHWSTEDDLGFKLLQVSDGFCELKHATTASFHIISCSLFTFIQFYTPSAIRLTKHNSLNQNYTSTYKRLPCCGDKPSGGWTGKYVYRLIDLIGN
jgi:hypothetical protein